MKRSLNRLVDCVVLAKDGEVGTVEQFYFDNLTWRIRYMIVETGKWLANRKVLISPVAIGKPEGKSRKISVNLTREQVRNSPDIDTQKPVSRQHETALHSHYGWPLYWQGGFYVQPGYGIAMAPSGAGETTEEEPTPTLREFDPHLHSTGDVIGYRIYATDGSIGHVDDFIVDDQAWDIQYMVVNTRNWLPGRKVLVSPDWIRRLRWADRKVFVDLSRDVVKKSPVFDASKPVSPGYEGKLLAHLKKPDVMVWVAFKFQAPAGADVHIAGTFNNWDPTGIKLGDDHKGVYATSMLLPAGRYEYKLIVDGEWCNGHGGGERVPNAFGTMNNVLVVSSATHRVVHLHAFSWPKEQVLHFVTSTRMSA